MVRYLLDTDICSYVMKRSHPALLERIRSVPRRPGAVRRDRGEMIGANDLLIAAHARSLKAILVTNNVREFGRVKGLKVENWTA